MSGRILRFVGLAGTAALLAFASAPVQAQFTPGFQLGGDKEVSPEERERNQANERAAREAQKKIVAPKASNDPWADVRTSEPPAKSAKPKAVAR
ncbi:MAG: hypothetical protein J0G95_09745 [Rhizobiales bacterium]|nr:hypothetical protein [Hyphomicrobiales bacterium]